MRRLVKGAAGIVMAIDYLVFFSRAPARLVEGFIRPTDKAGSVISTETAVKYR